MPRTGSIADETGDTNGMPITALNSTSALVVIDMQKGIVAMPVAHPIAGIVENVVSLVDGFRKSDRLVVLVHVGWSPGGHDRIVTRSEAPPPPATPPPGFSEYIDALAPDPARDVLILKHQWGAFYGTDLELQLRRRGITDIVICGISTSIGVESTARDAYERSFNITFAADAMTDMQIEAHERAFKHIFPRMGEIGTTQEILAKL